MALDAEVREWLVEARNRIAAQIDELISVAKYSYEEGPPDLRDVYAKLQNQLCEIDDLLDENT
jgi:hypothetical protein